MRLASILLLTAGLLAGCGHVGTVAVAPAPAVQTKAKAFDTPQLDTAASTLPPAAVTPAGATCLGLGTCGDTPTATLAAITKTKVGLLWRKLDVAGKVTTTSARPVSGSVVLRFMKGGVVVETLAKPFLNLTTSKPFAFEATSQEAADDIQAAVQMDGATAAP